MNEDLKEKCSIEELLSFKDKANNYAKFLAEMIEKYKILIINEEK